ncbi:C4-dicarboxylate TRAP transporter substrate-binding protein [Sinanaerobacter chloroacetimidivorans]|uniref:C4-dicarboxylate TRAP transporter substrate-binding protein n=1 Tax=Sinanaerobacter chloroacetimidivorans TaxID=2818044 RepID=A0A8J7VYJ2_9FIRM|nr:C4-dicarboxylate TRAP transporter substrate-binding protein [Sinanaerobacter chloroacetimidivorans]MBR0597467.1 C4-dicarboxylate TRAP transporter substrate-binding protein [Sinanaerobacter chloroacetimidivorans]
MKKTKRILCLVTVLCMIFSLAACGGGGATDNTQGRSERKTITLTIGGGHPSNTMSYTKVAADFFQPEVTKRCAEKTNYDIEWIDAYGGTVAGLDEALVATQNGLLDVFASTFAFDTKKLLLMNLPYYVPFSSQDPVIATKASRMVAEQFPEVYDGLWKQYNQKFLAFGPTGDYELISKFPIAKAADVKGHKLGGAGSVMPWLAGVGATPVQSTFNEVYTNLQTGVYEGYVVWSDTAMRYKWDEIAKYYTKVGFGAAAIQGITVNLDTWNSLPKEVQDIFLEVAAEYEELSAETAKSWDEEAFAVMEKNNGLQVTELSDEEKAIWLDSIENLPEKWIAAANEQGFPGREIMEAYIKAQEELGHVYLRDWLNE